MLGSQCLEILCCDISRNGMRLLHMARCRFMASTVILSMEQLVLTVNHSALLNHLTPSTIQFYIHCFNYPPPQTKLIVFTGNWTGVTLDSFLRCPGNPANNRLVRTFANISHVPCFLVKQALSRRDQYFKSGSTSISNISHFLLESAKENLNQMPFFGLVEYLPETDLLFEYTFGIKFLKTFSLNTKEPTIHLTAEQSEKINSLNQLDKELYAFAKKLFFERLANFSRLHSRNLQ